MIVIKQRKAVYFLHVFQRIILLKRKTYLFEHFNNLQQNILKQILMIKPTILCFSIRLFER